MDLFLPTTRGRGKPRGRQRDRRGGRVRHPVHMGAAAVTESVAIKAPVMTVWALITDPRAIPVLDPRLVLVSAHGDQSGVGSGYVLRMLPDGRASRDLQYLVTEASVPSRLVMTVETDGAKPATQVAQLVDTPTGTSLTWTTTAIVPFGMGRIARRAMQGEMRLWVQAIAREAEGRGT